MGSNVSRYWMWSEALEVVDRAERMHREAFRPVISGSRFPTWEPPVDVFETEAAVIVLVALPGVDPSTVQVSLDRDVLIFSGIRSFPDAWGGAAIHRLELPQGRFERRVSLPRREYESVRRSSSDGCLTIVLQKLGAPGG